MQTTADPAGRSLRPPAPEPSARDDPVVSRAGNEPPAHLELLNDDYALSILRALSAGPQRARELTDACEGSRSTIYRRLDRLVEAGFVTTDVTLDPDGHHCKSFRLVRNSVTVRVEGGELTVTARRDRPSTPGM